MRTHHLAGVALLCAAFSALAACGNHSGSSVDANGGGGDDSATEPDAAEQGCGLVTCASAGATCGPIGDGCGGVIQCGDCTAPETCGGAGTLFTCGDGGGGGGSCTPRTCADVGANCGKVADGCGGLTADCGGCGMGEACGAGGTPNVCAAIPNCTGLCLQVNSCSGMAQKTVITGTVTAPGHDDTATWGTPDPIYGALVYIPNGGAAPTYGTQPFSAGVACESCTQLVTGSPLQGVVTGVDGKFSLINAPCGVDVPLVIQLGRWRRQITIPAPACCATTTLTNAQTHLPRTRTGEPGDVRSDIPKMAFSTGDVDTLHCVLRKIGVADSEFTNPSGAGRIHMYQDNGAVIDNNTPAASTLYGSATTLDDYDMTLFECVGSRVGKSDANQNRLINYANAGGRVFATHFSYVWLTDDTTGSNGNTGPKPFYQTADFQVGQGSFDSATGYVDTTLQGDAATQARRVAFANWLLGVGASTTLGQIPVNVVRQDMNSVSALPATKAGTPAQQWLYSQGTPFTGPLHYTFDTPVAYAPDPAPTTQCGRVLFSDFHVSDATAEDDVFPTECSNGPMNAQEKTLEFMLFDLASCVGPPPLSCQPKTCADWGYNCGQAGTGCDDGVVLDCGTCPNGMSCGGGGQNVCGMNSCTPRSCADAGAQCGIIGDGCGGTKDCGPCPEGQSCGGGGANVCGGIIL